MNQHIEDQLHRLKPVVLTLTFDNNKQDSCAILKSYLIQTVGIRARVSANRYVKFVDTQGNRAVPADSGAKPSCEVLKGRPDRFGLSDLSTALALATLMGGTVVAQQRGGRPTAAFGHGTTGARTEMRLPGYCRAPAPVTFRFLRRRVPVFAQNQNAVSFIRNST